MLEELTQAREIVGTAFQTWTTRLEKLSVFAEWEQYLQISEYVALRRLWDELAVSR